MTPLYTDEREAKLRQLTSNIVAVIENTPDILTAKTVRVPDISTAVFDPHSLEDSESMPRAFGFMKDFISQDLKLEVKTIVDQLYDAKKATIWGHAPGYNVDNVGQAFLDNYCHALLTGPDGPLKCESPLGAFVLFGPETLYKDHSHTPNEIYLALTDGGEWRVGDSGWRSLEAGDTIFVPSETVHAIRTGSEPILTFSFWLEAGDMNTIEI